ncbi:hypothetical protein [Streptomyces sp. XH2]|uniref:hypothetical protein n=1 Tax=Streptomyces sp. XH2 TaxID=3412483 RepID=UPI003C7EAA9D
MICIAESFTWYDLHAVHEMGRTIDLVTYRYFGGGLLALETVASVQEHSPTRRTVAKRPAQPPASPDAGKREGPLAEVREALHEKLLALGEDTHMMPTGVCGTSPAW